MGVVVGVAAGVMEVEQSTLVTMDHQKDRLEQGLCSMCSLIVGTCTFALFIFLSIYLSPHRRATSGKFVPPIKRDQEEGSSFGNEVRSRVLYGARGQSKGSSDNQLPPELEGDERLKNIEPRMVELIMNEVSGCV